MDNKAEATDQSVLTHIQELVSEEHRLYEQGEQAQLEDADRQRLVTFQIELDRCWDLLRQRRALRVAGQDPGMAQIRSAQTVEKYE